MPALDEAEGIGAALDAAVTTLDALVIDEVLDDYEILVVDDGSTDGTGTVVSQAAASTPAIRLLRHPVNRGVGGALRTALDAARGGLVLYTDADMPVDLDELRRTIPLIEGDGIEMVAGRRTSFDQEPGSRRVASQAYDGLVHRLFGVRVIDVNFPFKLLATETARSLDLRSEGALVDVELLVRVEASGGRVVFLPMDYRARQAGESKTMRPGLLGRLALEMLRNLRELRRARSAR